MKNRLNLQLIAAFMLGVWIGSQPNVTPSVRQISKTVKAVGY